MKIILSQGDHTPKVNCAPLYKMKNIFETGVPIILEEIFNFLWIYISQALMSILCYVMTYNGLT